MTRICQMNLCRALLVISFQIFLGVSSTSGAAEQIRADVLTDIAFITPGETQAIQVRIENPKDSGIVIANAGFMPHRFELTLLNRYSFLEIIDARGCPLLDNNASLGLKRACETMSQDVFPINPGDSVVITYRYLDIAENATPGTILLMSNITLRMYDDEDRALPELYLERDAIRIVADPDNPGELPALNTSNPMAGMLDADLSFFIEHPDVVQVGDSFELAATLVNHSEQSYTVLTSMSGQPLGAEYTVGGCTNQQVCQGGQMTIGANETVEGITFPVRYRSPVRQQGILQILRPFIRVTDSMDRAGFVYADQIRVAIEHDTHFPTLEAR